MEKESTKHHKLHFEVKAILEKVLSEFKAPTSVYRLQFNNNFKFKDAVQMIPFLKALGAEAVYCSPYFQSAPGSYHGYDVTNPNRINPELGGEKNYKVFCKSLQKHGLRQIVDVVSNHMGISGKYNLWWRDVLEDGPVSRNAKFFDIDWEPEKKELNNKVLIPVLGDLYGQTLERGEIQLHFTSGSFSVQYADHEFPVSLVTYPVILEHDISSLRNHKGLSLKHREEFKRILKVCRSLKSFGRRPRDTAQVRHKKKEEIKDRLKKLCQASGVIQSFIKSRTALFNGQGEDTRFDLLDDLLNRQSYRLAFWRVASEEINYRRFFDVNELAAIRIEDGEVFTAHHRMLFSLIREGKVHGLRVDHPDGLYDPSEYFERLQETYVKDRLLSGLKRKKLIQDAKPSDAVKNNRLIQKILEDPRLVKAAPLYVVIEKILDRKEALTPDWRVHGTVGYDFLNQLNGIFILQKSEKAFDSIYREFTGFATNFDELVYSKKKFFALIHMAGEINQLGFRLDRISEKDRRLRDFTRNHLTLAIREVIACFPVYRTYLSPRDHSVSERDTRFIYIAIQKAKKRTPALNPMVYDFLENVLLNRFDSVSEEDKAQYRDFAMRFQQLTGPVMAKGLEDTAFYIYNRFIALNEVGGSPEHFGNSVPDFHRQNIERKNYWPYGFLASSTHDTKRSEDVRYRLSVLSEDPKEWRALVFRWTKANERYKTLLEEKVPDPNTEYLIYQILLGIWPSETQRGSSLDEFKNRIWDAVLKSVREAKLQTSWQMPNEEYEKALKVFVDGVISEEPDHPFLKSFAPFAASIARWGFLNSLSATVVKMGSPGVCDVYWGNELWDLSLVDPDNRRPVDFVKRSALLKEIEEKAKLKPEALCAYLSGLYRPIPDPRLKLYLIWRLLNFRKENPEVFFGDYMPLEVRGAHKDHVMAFYRKNNGKVVIFVAARFLKTMAAGSGAFPIGERWRGTFINLPGEIKPKKFRDLLSPREILSKEGGLPLEKVFGYMSIAVLCGS
jgi:(1->4)-alpha-D-glucan 1-alpha-D-glucosylmutase